MTFKTFYDCTTTFLFPLLGWPLSERGDDVDRLEARHVHHVGLGPAEEDINLRQGEGSDQVNLQLLVETLQVPEGELEGGLDVLPAPVLVNERRGLGEGGLQPVDGDLHHLHAGALHRAQRHQGRHLHLECSVQLHDTERDELTWPDMMTARELTSGWDEMAARLRQFFRHQEILLTPDLNFTDPRLVTSIRKT